MEANDWTTQREESVCDSTQRKDFESSAVNRQSAGLCDMFGASFQHDDFHLGQRQFTAEPKPDWAAANDDNIEFSAHDRHTLDLTGREMT